MEKNYKLNNLAKLHAIQNMMEGHSEIEGQKLPDFLIDFFKDAEHDLEMLVTLREHIKEYYNISSGWVEFDLYYQDKFDKKGTSNAKRIREWLDNGKEL